MSATSPKLRAPPPIAQKANKLSQWLFDNQAISSSHFSSRTSMCPRRGPYTSKFLTLSYYNPRTGKYGGGPSDLCFVAFYIVVCTGIRAALMQHVLVPLGWSWGASTKKDVTRFAEQGWVLAYYSAAWPLGMYIYYQSPYFLNLEGLWAGWPHRELDELMKGYFLVQWAYWMQQLIVVNLEASRKDYWEMVIHHIITTSLIAGSYAYHLTRVGHLILVLMDAVELVFPLAKCLKYLGFKTVCDVIFGLFMFTWAWTRHIFYLMLLPRPAAIHDGALLQGPRRRPTGPFPAPEQGWSHLLEPFYDPEGTVCLTDGIHTGFLTFLLALELVICVTCTREVLGLIEQEVGVESVDLLAARRRPNGRQQKSSGLRLGRSSDRKESRKEILNRIGCDKQIE
ncbi:hypothetical protein PG994_000615 [Apiospora phragmitis]|uniref:TLC domain-containing protein n=1 Tax=Apiospora phragmitis TaxID=2905665 RepID=A0ABR1X6P1_9PEZI